MRAIQYTRINTVTSYRFLVQFAIMEASFFDVKQENDVPPDMDMDMMIEEGEIEIIEPEGNPMEKLESQSIKQEVDNLIMRMLTGAIDGHEQAHVEEMHVDEERDGDGLLNSTTVHFVSNFIDYSETPPQTVMVHEVVVPAVMPAPKLRARNTEAPAMSFDFKLDKFQEEAIQVIENSDKHGESSLLVAAPTAAGKTAIAQYAISEALRNGKSVIYTSPIKTLSNQKYRELEEKFDLSEIGLLTGDVSLNPTAPIKVMTTEILRSMLYRKDPCLDHVAWVIFDEIHYMNNEERGVVWEESIIQLKASVRLLFLSATIPNALQFAGWVCWLKKAPIHVVTTYKRPVPLCHYVLPVGSEKMFEIVSQSGFFRKDEYPKAMAEMDRGLEREREKEKREKKRTMKETWIAHVTRSLKERELLPCVAFAFSRADCEHYAAAIRDMDMTSESEKQQIRGIVENATERLTDDDRLLSQIKNLTPLLIRGIAVHHAGLLPIVKEVVELLFAHTLVKMLFATETFAMGVNVPARTVLFTSAMKFDGKKNRWLTASEYAQMSGRAGRRDSCFKVGLSILMLDERISIAELEGIVKGKLDPLESRFRLSYNMLLNLLAAPEGKRPEEMMELSLRRYQNTMEVPELSKAIADKEEALSKMTMSEDPQMAREIEKYLELETQIKRIRNTAKKIYMQPRYLLPFFHTGRLLKIKLGDLDFGWGALIRWEKKSKPDEQGAYYIILEMLIQVDAASKREFNNTGLLKPAGGEGQSSWEIVPMTVFCIDEIGVARFRVPKDMNRADLREKLGRLIIGFTHERMQGSPPLLDPIKDMGVNNPALEEALEKMRYFQRKLGDNALDRKRRGTDQERSQFEALTEKFAQKAAAEKELKQLRQELRKKKADIRLGTELFRRKELLIKLLFIDEDNNLKWKGRIAACISTGDELLLTELLVSGKLEKIVDDADIAAILSCFVCDERSATRLGREMTEHHKMIQDFARKMATKVTQTGQELVEGEYVDQFKPSMMEVTKKWMKGGVFSALLKSTDLYEGTIIRCLRRLEELLRELETAAGVAGNVELQDRFDLIRTKIRRDIVFSSSLYL